MSSQTSLESTGVEYTFSPQSTILWIPSVNCSSPANPAVVASNALKMFESNTYTGIIASLDAGFNGFSTSRFTLTRPSTIASPSIIPNRFGSSTSIDKNSAFALVFTLASMTLRKWSASLARKWLSPAWTMNLSSPANDFAFNTASPNPRGSDWFTQDTVEPSIIL